MENNSNTNNIATCPLVESNMWFLEYLEDVYIINCVFNFVFAISAVVGNFFVLYSIIKTPSLHKPSSFLICNLAVTDLATGLLVQPLYVIYKIAEMNGLVDMSCYCGVVVNMLANLFSGMSFMTVTCISIDRYLALYLHLRYVAVVTTQRVVKIITMFWLIGIFFVSFYPWKVSVSLGFGVIALVMCLGISSFTFFKIFQVVRKHQTQVYDNTASYNVEDKRIAFHALNLSKYRRSVLTMVYIYIILAYR
ncbi:5-hydroxytryptamine receptor-like [Actinia tenebrosa]|uniref:5-hydroxytryptamine receptor-like n=1 Tax=Actinia tenebrosa TaxID=6105 RepID=A0A6P8I602_ACTTE|nr:5-hydroxytryptamine receptor-like [Actinia tenebrosa]